MSSSCEPVATNRSLPPADIAEDRKLRRILLVDDEPSVRELLGRLLEDEGYQVRRAENGIAALDAVRSEEVDLVLLDLNMPLKGGWATFESLSVRHPLLPVVIMTGRPNQWFTALNAGVAALLEKPLDIEQLLCTVRRLLSEPADVRLARKLGKAGPFYHVRPESPHP